MITCKHCDTENPLGTLFCRGCGERIEVELQDVMGSVKAERHLQQELHLLGTARNAANLALIALAVVLCFDWLVVSELPRGSIAAADPRPVEELLPALAATGDGGQSELALGLAASDDILAWRRQHAASILAELGLDQARIRELQLALAESQRDNGSFRGDDGVAATALAVLALQALPGDETVDAAAERGRSWLLAQAETAKRGPDVTTLLWAAPFLELGSGLSDRDRRLAIAQLGRSEHPRFHAAILPLVRPDEVTTETLVLDHALRGEPAWRAVARLALGVELEESRLPENWTVLDGLDRWAVAQAGWWEPARLGELRELLRGWQGELFGEPYHGFSSTFGPHGPRALQILTLTAPARIPISRLPPAD